jgi:hypothetical protein
LAEQWKTAAGWRRGSGAAAHAAGGGRRGKRLGFPGKCLSGVLVEGKGVVVEKEAHASCVLAFLKKTTRRTSVSLRTGKSWADLSLFLLQILLFFFYFELRRETRKGLENI